MQIKLNGISMGYSLDGKPGSPALVLIHGFPFSRAMWKSQIAALKGSFRILSYDLRGMGKSTLGKAPQLLEAYVDDLFALLDHLKIRRAALCGLSMGGYIALRAVAREAGRFSALVLADTRADADSDEGKLKRAGGIKAIREKGAAAFSKGMLPRLLAAETVLNMKPAARGLLKMMLANQADGMCNALAAMAGRADTGAVLKNPGMPLLILCGDKDELTPPELAKSMAEASPGARLVLIPGAGHASNLDCPELFSAELGGFLMSLKP